MNTKRRPVAPERQRSRRAVVLGLGAGAIIGAMPSMTMAAAPENVLPGKLPKGLPTRLFGGPFDLIDHHGKARTDQDFQGQFMLLFFGYTYCPDICPTNLQALSAALDMSAPDVAGRVQPLFVSIDPDRDRPEVLKDYVSHFHPRLLGLTGTEAQVRRIAKAYRIHRSKVVTDATAPADDYLVNHSSLTYLMAPDGSFLTIFPHDTPADKIATALRRYVPGG